MREEPTLHQQLPPTISVDPGSASSAAVVRIGDQCADAKVVLNPQPAKKDIGHHAFDLSPEYDYLAALRAIITELAHKYGDAAREWWLAQGHPVPDGAPVWLFAVEKINYPSLLPGRRVTECETGSVFAAKGIAEHLCGWWGPGRTIWQVPYRADTRWEPRFGGTGDPYDYFPERLLADYSPNADGSYPALDDPRFRSLRIKDVCAAWSVASDAASDYAAACIKRYGQVLPPHLADGVHADLAASRRRYYETRFGPLPPVQVVAF